MGYSTATNGVLNCYKWDTQLSQMGYSKMSFQHFYCYKKGTNATLCLTM